MRTITLFYVLRWKDRLQVREESLSVLCRPEVDIHRVYSVEISILVVFIVAWQVPLACVSLLTEIIITVDGDCQEVRLVVGVYEV